MPPPGDNKEQRNSVFRFFHVFWTRCFRNTYIFVVVQASFVVSGRSWLVRHSAARMIWDLFFFPTRYKHQLHQERRERSKVIATSCLMNSVCQRDFQLCRFMLITKTILVTSWRSAQPPGRQSVFSAVSEPTSSWENEDSTTARVIMTRWHRRHTAGLMQVISG